MTRTINGQFIDGAWQAGNGSAFASTDPAFGRVVWSGRAADAADVDAAMGAARKALAAWSCVGLDARRTIVRRLGDLLETHAERLAATIAEEMGKPLWEARTEVASMRGKVELSIRSQDERAGTRSSEMGPGRAVLRHRPHGVLAVFGPYNFPGHLPNGHIIPALLAGNTLVFKPSDQTPKVGQDMLWLWAEAGLPAGVLNLVQGAAETGQALAAHPDLDGLLFTGSSRTGAALHAQFAGRPGKLLALEMGGNNPLIVDAVADVEAALHSIIQSAFVTSGQRCTCARRLFLPRTPQADRLLERLVDVAGRIKAAAWNVEPQPYMGPVVSAGAARMLVAAERNLLQRGGEGLLGMGRGDDDHGFVSPAIVDVTTATNIPDEEHFGPLLQVIRYDDLDEAIALANNTRFGLSAGFIGDDEARYRHFWTHIRAGIVNWNSPTTGASGSAPFGGVGDSGNLRPGAWYAADYCAYPVASVEVPMPQLPETLSPGLML